MKKSFLFVVLLLASVISMAQKTNSTDKYYPIFGVGAGCSYNVIVNSSYNKAFQANLQISRIDIGIYRNFDKKINTKEVHIYDGVKLGCNFGRWLTIGAVLSKDFTKKEYGAGGYMRIMSPFNIIARPYIEGHVCTNNDYGLFVGMNLLFCHGK